MNRLEKHTRLPVRLRDSLVSKLPLINDRTYNLNISHSHKFMWFRVPKVGTRTILHEFENEGVTYSKTPARLLNHKSTTCDNYFKFAFVRNPWDRIVSCWSNKVVDHNRFGFKGKQYEDMLNFSKFVQYIETINIEKTDRHVKPQYLSIDLNCVNFVGRFESFAPDLTKVKSELGMTMSNPAKKNSSNRISKNYKDYYDTKSIDIVSRLYEKDIDYFKYTF